MTADRFGPEEPTDAASLSEGFSTECGWCRRQVINFVAPPAMVEVTYEPDGGHRRSVDRICVECYTELIKLIASRADTPRPGRRAATAI